MNPPANTPPRIGIVMLSALGDTVHVLPIVTALKRHAPGVKISWVLQPGPALLVQGHPAVDEIIPFDRRRGWRAFAAVRRELIARPFDLVLDFQPYFKAGLITLLARAPMKLGFDVARARDLNWLFTTHRIPPRPQRHIQDQFFEFLDYIGVPHRDAELDWGLAPTAEERARAAAILAGVERPIVGFVVATSKPPKNWMPERFGALATRIAKEHGGRSLLLGDTTPLESAAAAAIMATTDAKPVPALGSGLRTTIALLEACDVVVSPDTGPFHIAVAMNVPAVGLFGYTNPKRVGPYRRFQDLLVDAYGDPGENYPVTMRYRPGHMERITTDMVMEKVSRALERYPRGSRT